MNDLGKKQVGSSRCTRKDGKTKYKPPMEGAIKDKYRDWGNFRERESKYTNV